MKEFTVEIPLRWGDMDAMSHLNNTIYFRLMEEARIQWFKELGFSTLPTGMAPILAHASCDFIKPMDYPGTARVTHLLTRLGRSSVEHDVLIEKIGEAGTPYARGRTVIVWFDYESGRSAPWPAEMVERLGG